MAADDSLERIERVLDESIKSQKERLARMEKLYSKQAEATPWQLLAIGTSAVAVLCAWRLVRDKQQYEVRVSFLLLQPVWLVGGAWLALNQQPRT